MTYMGSKNKLAKYLLPLILKDRLPDQWYIEPFMGGANMIDKVDGNRLGNDKHYYLIEMWKALQNGWIPPTDISKEYYNEIKKNYNKYDPALVGFVGFLCSFGGKFWNGYASNKKGDNYAERGSKVLLKQIQNLKDVTFTNLNYYDVPLQPNSIIYCDPPYKGTTQYSTSKNFDHYEFWNWCRKMSKNGHKVFISEYNAPEDFECLISIEHSTILNKNEKSKRIEKLFIAH